MKHLTLLGLSTTCLMATAQPEFEWAQSAGSAQDEEVSAMTTDRYGNVYRSGEFLASVDADPGPGVLTFTNTGTSQRETFLQKLNPNGSLIWAKHVVGTGELMAMCSDTAGNLYLSGTFLDDVSIDNSSVSSTGSYKNVFVAKISGSGVVQWIKKSTVGATAGGTGNARVVDMACDPAGNTYTIGSYYGLLNGVASSNGFNDIFMVKYRGTDGTLQATRRFGGNSLDEGVAICADATHYYIAGTFQGSGNFNGAGAYTLSAEGSYDVFVGKYSVTNHAIAYAGGIGSTGFDNVFALTADEFGNAYLYGSVAANADVQPAGGTVTYAGEGGILEKISPTGSMVWVKPISGSVGIGDICLDADRNIYLAGRFSGTVDLDPGPATANVTWVQQGEDMYVNVLDSTGAFLGQGWSIVGQGSTTADHIAVDAYKNVYISGFYDGSRDFNPIDGTYNLGSQGQSDTYLMKLGLCQSSMANVSISTCGNYTAPDGQVHTASGNYVALLPAVNGCDSIIRITLNVVDAFSGTDVQSACDSFTWIDGVTYTASTDTATFTVVTPAGCDSIVTLDLTLTALDTAVSVSGATISAAQDGAAYQWFDCQNNEPILGATEQSFTPTMNGQYAVEVSAAGCTVVSACQLILSTAIASDHASATRVFPVPATDHVMLVGVAVGARVDLFDVRGAILRSENATRSSHRVDLQGIAPGVYTLRSSSGGDTFVARVIVE